MKQLAIVGASGHGKVVADLAEILGYEVAFFDDIYPVKCFVEHWKVIGSFTDLLRYKHFKGEVVVAIGDNNIRYSFYQQLVQTGFKIATLIHPSSVVSQYAYVGEGSVILANAVVNAFAQVGEYCIINTSTIVEHDCIIGNAVHLSPNVALAGSTTVKDFAWLGIGSVTRQLSTIGKNAIIGANATVVNDISENSTVVGSPAVAIKNKNGST